MSNPNTLPETVELPLLPLRDVVVFPHMVIPLFVGRPKSIKALEVAMEAGKNILLVAQKSAAKDEPEPEDLYRIGCMANILQMLKLPDGTVKVLVEGTQRAASKPSSAIVTKCSLRRRAGCRNRCRGHEIEALRRAVVAQFDQYVKLNKKIPPEIFPRLPASKMPAVWPTRSPRTCRSSSSRSRKCWRWRVRPRIDRLLSQLESEIDILQVEKRIRGRVKRQMEKSQREYYLNEQVKAIQKELGEGEEGADLEELDKKIKAAGMSKEGMAKARASSRSCKLMSPMSAEATVVRNFIETLIGLPWRKKTRISKDLREAERCSTGSLGPGQGQGTHHRVSRRATARRQGEGADPLPGRPSGRRQDLARPIDRQGHRAASSCAWPRWRA
jgi:ATP-dependent Lon protease